MNQFQIKDFCYFVRECSLNSHLSNSYEYEYIKILLLYRMRAVYVCDVFIVFDNYSITELTQLLSI